MITRSKFRSNRNTLLLIGFLVISIIAVEQYDAASNRIQRSESPTGQTIASGSSLPSWARSWAGVPWDVTNPSDSLLSAQLSDGKVKIAAKGHYIWQTGYVWNPSKANADGTKGGWQPFTFPQTSQYDGWASSSAVAEVPLKADEVLNGDNYVLAYTCKWKNERWYCGCLNADTCGRWQLQTFTARGMADAVLEDMSRYLSNPSSVPDFQQIAQSVVVATDEIATDARADFDADGTIDFDDFFLFADAFGTANAKFDLSGNGKVDFDDFFRFADEFGKKVESGENTKWDFELQQTDINMNIYDLTVSAPVCLAYKGQNPSYFVGKYDYEEITIPDTSFKVRSNSIIKSTRLEHDDCVYNIWSYILINKEQLAEIIRKYPDGKFPVNIKIRIGDSFDLYFKDVGTTIFEGVYWISDVPDITKYTDNYEYKIGVIQVVPPAYNLSNKEICFVKDGRDRPTYGFQDWGVYEDCWDSLRIDRDPEKDWLKRSVKHYKLTDVLYSDEQYTLIDEIESPRTYGVGPEEEPPSTVKLYPLKYIGKFWEDLLAKHGITSTVLRKNPRFGVTLLGPFEKAYPEFEPVDGQAPRAEVKNFFKEVVSENHIDLSNYDFIVYIQYVNVNEFENQGFRPFAAGRNAYVSYPLNANGVINKGFLSVVHELGHSLFGANDLYVGLGIKYPEGVPDLTHFPQKNACIMAKEFGLVNMGEVEIGNYDTWFYGSPEGLDVNAFYTRDPDNFVLCVDDIVEITGGGNPDCSAEEFYAGKCGDCTSLNYLSCKRTEEPLQQ